ncbi:MAG TPA: restriction endonuclease, partial [Longimicrobiaceae bacterium]|nr:restriction endonuclease [Longimicrobiaceae bacterium]
MNTDSLVELLNSLPDRAPGPSRLAADVIPGLVEWLGYDPGWVRFEYAYVYGAARVRVADAVLLEPEIDRAFLLFEVRDSRRPIKLVEPRSEFYELREVAGAYAGIILTPAGVTVFGPELSFVIEFGKVTLEHLEELRRRLQLGYAWWYERSVMVGPRKPVPRRGRPGQRPECESLLRAVRDAVTNDEKKQSLEGLVRFLIERVDYLRVKYTDIRTASSEIDLIVENRGRSRHTMFDEFGRHFLIECKNWSGNVGAKEVRDFVGKLLKTRIRLGILA